METDVLAQRFCLPAPSVQLLQQQHHYRGRIINVRTDTVQWPDGTTQQREVAEHPGGVCVCPILPDGRYVLVQQYRHPTGGMLLEFPAGKLDVAGETPQQAVARELWEETGYYAGQWEPLFPIWVTPGFCNELIHLYRATDLILADTAYDNSQEGTAIALFHWNELREAMRAGYIRDGKTLALLAVESLRKIDEP